jgi:hypothetical protein
MSQTNISLELSSRIEGPGAIGKQGDSLYALPHGKNKKRCFDLTPEHKEWLLDGLMYINIRTVLCLKGEIRGQLLLNSNRIVDTTI